ncbi:hypothetical protein ACM72L_28920 [Pseudomonas aeruginosa]
MSKELNKAPAEQAGGDEGDLQAEGAQEVPSPVSQEYDRHLISLLRKGEALPGHQEEAADEIERLRDWNDHLNNTVLPNILNPNFLMLMKGGERLLDLCTKDGKFIGVSLNDMKDVFDWMVTHARIAPDHAALAQPSPARSSLLINGYQLRAALEFIAPDGTAKQLESEARIEWRQQDADFLEAGLYAWCAEYPEEGCVLLDEEPATAQPSPAQAEQAEAERPEVVAWQYRVTAGPQTGWSLWHPGKGEEFERSYTVERRPLMTVAQHERIVGELRAVIAQLRQHKNDYMDSGQETYRALQNEIREREAEIARLDGLVSGRTAERDAALARVAELERKLRDEENAHTTTIEQRDNAEHWADQLAKAIAERFGVDIGEHSNLNCPWNEALVWMQQPPAQAQHSVPEGVTIERDVAGTIHIKVGDFDFIQLQYQRPYTDNASTWKLAERIASLLAAAPGKEGV